jgi:hypothetical protein
MVIATIKMVLTTDETASFSANRFRICMVNGVTVVGRRRCRYSSTPSPAPDKNLMATGSGDSCRYGICSDTEQSADLSRLRLARFGSREADRYLVLRRGYPSAIVSSRSSSGRLGLGLRGNVVLEIPFGLSS